MNRLILVLATALFGILSMAEEPTPEKKDLIDTVRELTGTTAIELSQRFVNEYAQNIAASIGKRNPNMGPRHHEIMREEISSLVIDGLKNDKRLDALAYSIYSDHFDSKELEEIVNFYGTNTGQKLVTVMRTYLDKSADESVAIIKTLESRITSEMPDRINARFELEGL